MRSGRRLILCIAITKAANPAHIVKALLKCREAAIGSGAAAPRIILGFSGRCGGKSDENCQYKQEFHTFSGFAWLSSINPGGLRLFPHAFVARDVGSALQAQRARFS
jgi:hypothetical protein